MKPLYYLLMTILCLFILLSCSDDTPTGTENGGSSSQPVADVEITVEVTHMLVATTQHLTAATYDETGSELTGREVQWHSSDTATADVDEEGVVTAHAVGTATVTAESEGIEHAVDIQIEEIILEKRGQGGMNGCGLTESGTLYCWGHNYYGEVGDGTREQREEPVLVEGGHVFKTISVGSGFTTALTEDGTVYSWGRNNYGQLGVGDRNDRSVPTRIESEVKFVQISAYLAYTLGLTEDGQAWAWGWNIGGRLGDGTEETRLTPVPVQGGLVFEYISAGTNQSIGLTKNGTLYTWGRNRDGVLGIGVEDESHRELTPTEVSGGHTFVSASAGENAIIALTPAGEAWAWGQNSYGKLGDGTNDNRYVPVRVAVDHVFKYVVTKSDQTYGITVDGTAYGWGYNGSSDSQTLGVESTAFSVRTPSQVVGNHTFRHIYMGSHSKMGVTEEGDFYMWGWNGNGQLGLGDTDTRMEPTLRLSQSFVPLKN